MKIMATALCMVLLLAMHGAAQVDPPIVTKPAPESAATAATAPTDTPPPAAAPPSTAPTGTPPPAAAPTLAPGAVPPGALAPTPAPAAPAPTGDEIHLKSGAVLKGVQVLRRSPLGIEVQVTPDVAFFIPRKQVVEIKFDDIEPSKQRQAPEAEHKQATFFGAKIEPAMSEKLNKPLPESCLKSGNKDLVEVMALISAETGVKIDVTDAVKGLPSQERMWDYTLEPGTTLTALIQSNLPERFINLAIVYQYDRLVITTREDAAAHENVEAGTVPAPTPPTQ